MKQRYMYFVATLMVAFAPLCSVRAVEAPLDHLVIVAVQTAAVGAIGNDFVEIYNPTAETIDVTGWRLQYRAASATGSAAWTTKKGIMCPEADTACTRVYIQPGGHLVFSTYDIPGVQSEQRMSSGLSDAGGQLRIAQSFTSGMVSYDMVGYGTALDAETSPAIGPQPGEVLVRKVVGGKVQDTNNNAADFEVIPGSCFAHGGTALSPVNNLCAAPPVPEEPPVTEEPPVEEPVDPLPEPEPQQPSVESVPTEEPPAVTPPDPPVEEPIPLPEPEVPQPEPEVPAPEPNPETPPQEPPIITEPPAPVTYAPLQITELLPDPLSPLTDANDEYVELYNPGTQDVSAEGYVIETGLTFTYHYTLGVVIVPAGGYVTISSAQSHLTLSNTAGAARLRDPAGAVIDQTADYGAAPGGQAWAKVQDVWQWSTVATPGVVNAPTPAEPPHTLPPSEEEEPIPTPEVPSDGPEPTPETTTPEEPAPTPDPATTYLPVYIVELLPDPVAPATDATDEYIELFNPGSATVNLAGYKLQAGSDFRYSYTFGDVALAPGAYVAFMSGSTHIPLTNSGTPVQLLDPAGRVVYTVASYGAAKPGQTWAKMAEGWRWTTTVTPGAGNVLTLPPAKAPKAAKKATGTTKKKAAAKAAATKKVAAAKTASTGNGAPEIADQASFNYVWLLPVGLLVAGYVVYEYRQNIARSFRKLTQGLQGRKEAVVQTVDTTQQKD